ncbi:MAG: leucine-rich repeat domain-containing protein [Muribaculum sp.]|nr:leucine-rich repeat domain-containing protein [Muribaculum sp.]
MEKSIHQAVSRSWERFLILLMFALCCLPSEAVKHFTVGDLEYQTYSNTDKSVVVIDWNPGITYDEWWFQHQETTGLPDIRWEFYEEVGKKGELPIIDGLELKDVEIPSTVTYEDKTYVVNRIGEACFSQAINVRSVKIPSTVKVIEGDAFSECIYLKEIELPSSVSSISSDEAFNYCLSLQSFKVDPENESFCSFDGVLYTKDMKKLCYFPAGKIGDFVVPDDVETIRAYSFSGAMFVNSVIMNDNVTTIGKYAFEGCYGLTSIKLSGNVEKLGDSVLWDVNSLKHLCIPEGVEQISNEAISGKSFETIDLPSTLKTLAYQSIQTSILKKVICRAVNPPAGIAQGILIMFYDPDIDYTDYDDPILYVPGESIDEYKNIYYGIRYKEILPLDYYVSGLSSLKQDNSSEISVFDLMGNIVLTTDNKNDFQSLPQGIYIINGQKYIVR